MCSNTLAPGPSFRLHTLYSAAALETETRENESIVNVAEIMRVCGRSLSCASVACNLCLHALNCLYAFLLKHLEDNKV